MVSPRGLMYILYMARRLSITEVRRRLPTLVREAGEGRSVEILNRGEVVARLVGPRHDAASTADVLLAVRARQPRSRRRLDVSTQKNLHLTRLRK
jgi:antitoxin (DNA-binding transcriptional repressor) of toxin-antitoxin stability system